MKPIHSLIPILLGVLLWSTALDARAAVNISASLEKSVIRVGESTRMTVEVSSTNAQSTQVPSLPDIEGLTFSSRGAPSQKFSFSSVNGRNTQNYSTTFVFDVIAVLPGTYTFDRIQLSTAEGTVTANELSLTVLEADQSQPTPAPGSTTVPQTNQFGIYLLAEATKTEAYVGEEILLNYFLLVPQDLANRINISRPNDNPGQFQDFWVETHSLDNNREEQTVRLQNNKLYRKYTLYRHSLFPLRDGEFTITPTTIEARVARPVSVLFNQFEEVPVQSNTVDIAVKRLPERGLPSTFKGAVGQYKLSASVEEMQVNEGDPVTLRVLLEGTGNLKNAPAPELPDLSQFDQFDPTSTEDIRINKNGVSGRLEYTYILIPHGVHADTIGPVQFSFFDPSQETYVELASDPIALSIIPGEGSTRVGSGFTTRRMIVRLGDDFRFISTSPLALASVNLAVVQSPLFWLLSLLPITGVAGAFAWNRKQLYLMSNPAEQRRRKAPSNAQAALDGARSAFSSGDKDRVYSLLEKMVREYLNDRWQINSTGMTRNELEESLAQCNYPESTRQHIHEMMEIVEGKRFSGTATISDTHVKGDLDRAEILLSEIVR